MVLLPYLLACGPPPVTVETTNGGLSRAATILQARFGTSIHYEGVPHDIEGVHFVRTPSPNAPLAITRLGDGGFTFSYPADATPRQALDAAVAAYNALPDGYVRYTVRDTGEWFDLVPAASRDGTAWKVSTPLLDAVITIPSNTGHANDLFLAVAHELSEVSGMPVSCDSGLGIPSLSDPYTSIRLPSATGPARTLLGEIISRSDRANSWSLLWYQSPDHPPTWVLLFDLVQPEDEAHYNRTPLVPPRSP